MNLLEKSRPSSKTLAWVGGAHVLILLIVFLIPNLFKPKPPQQFIEMIPFGSADPGDGDPDSADRNSGGSSAKGGSKGSTPPIAVPQPPAPVQKAEPPVPIPPAPAPSREAAKTPIPEAADPIVPPVKKVEPKVEKPKPVPAVIKPSPAAATNSKDTAKPAEKPKPKIKVNLDAVTKSTSNGNGTNTKATDSKEKGNSSSNGLNASDVADRLGKKFGKGVGEGSGDAEGNKGIPRGTGQGGIGDPSGTGNAPWYDTYIGIQLKKNWARPATAGALSTLVAVRILRDGTVEFVRITRSSGDAAMDQSVTDAVQAVKKINPPPATLPDPYDRIVNFEL